MHNSVALKEHHNGRTPSPDKKKKMMMVMMIVQEWQQLAHLYQHAYPTQLISHVRMYQPILPITHALLPKNGVRRCCGKNKVVAFSLSLNPVHFLHPKGKLCRGRAMQ